MTDDPTGWEAALDELDVATRDAEHLLRENPEGPFPSFAVARPQAPLPRHLVARAQELLHRQLRLQIALAHALEDCQRQRSFVERVADVSSRTAERPSAYVDHTA